MNHPPASHPLAIRFAVLFALLFTASVVPAEVPQPQPLDQETADEYKLDRDFYKKMTRVQDILIASSDRVSDHAHAETAYQFDMVMRSITPEVAQRIREKKVLCLLIGHNEFTSQLPQFKSDKTGKELDFYNWRNRGFLTHRLGRPTVVFAEEDVLEYEGGMQIESILIHEFGHVIHGAGFDKELQERLTDAFQRARAKGIWNDGRAAQRFRRVKSDKPVSLFDALVKSFPEQSPELIRKCLDSGDILVNGRRVNSRVKVTKKDKVLIMFGGPKECYAHKNRAEYWAEGVQCWYDTNRTMDHDHNHIHTREGLEAYDPALAELCRDVLGESEWRFVSPRKRAGEGHLKDFDPAKSPEVVDPEHIETAAYDYYDEYWKDYWQRLHDKHALLPKLKTEGIAALAEAARENGDAIKGSILFPHAKLGCTKCHQPGDATSVGPDLSRIDSKLTDEYLVESILEPSKTIKKGFETVAVITVDGKSLSGRMTKRDDGTIVIREAENPERAIELTEDDIDQMKTSMQSSMPEGLVDQLANRQEFLDLVKYLIDVRDRGGSGSVPHSLGGGVVSDELRGLALIDDLKCLACHEVGIAKHGIPPKQAPDLKWAAGRIDPAYVAAFVADPQKVKPGTTMPSMTHHLPPGQRTAAAKKLTHYLASLSDRKITPQAIDAAAAKRGNELFHEIGCVACHSPRDADGEETMAESSVALGNVSAKYHLTGLAEFLEQPHVSRPSGRMPSLKLSHFEAVDIASYLLQVQAASAEDVPPFQIDQALATAGKQLFGELGCAECHDVQKPLEKAYPSLVGANLERGCLSSESGNWPTYKLAAADKSAIAAAIQRGSEPLSADDQIDLTLTTFRCLSCHQRDDLGGVPPDRNHFFHTTNENLGEQGRIPPPLTGVGAKLNADWMRDVLVSGKSIRPYMKTRMPQYGAANVEHVIPLLQQTDTLPPVEYASLPDQKAARDAGHELVGSTGLKCVACHTFQLKPAETMPAVDLTEMAARLKKDWFYHYMRSPQRFSHNTVMPTFFPGGKAMRTDILDGDADRQIEAIWTWLLDGRQARTPRGLIREPIELLASNEAVMLRRSYPNIGKRGIGVGYPGQVNLAYDAEQMRLALIWKGRFAETSGVWRGQGHGRVNPLGTDQIAFVAGPELDHRDSPWIVDDGRPPQHQFRGYYLDDLRRPTFMYRFDGIDVEDYPYDEKDAKSGDMVIRRRLTFSSETSRDDIAFRLAADPAIVDEGEGVFLIGKSLRIKIGSGHAGEIIDVDGGKQLRVPLELTAGKTTLELTYQW